MNYQCKCIHFPSTNESFMPKTIFIQKMKRRCRKWRKSASFFRNSKQTNCHTKYIYVCELLVKWISFSCTVLGTKSKKLKSIISFWNKWCFSNVKFLTLIKFETRLWHDCVGSKTIKVSCMHPVKYLTNLWRAYKLMVF